MKNQKRWEWLKREKKSEKKEKNLKIVWSLKGRLYREKKLKIGFICLDEKYFVHNERADVLRKRKGKTNSHSLGRREKEEKNKLGWKKKKKAAADKINKKKQE